MFQASVFSLCLLSDNYHIYIFMSNKHKKFCFINPFCPTED